MRITTCLPAMFLVKRFVITLVVIIGSALISVAEPTDSIALTQQSSVKYLKRGHSLWASVGAGVITSDITLGWANGNPAVGCDWEIGYSWISSKKIGAGFLYSGYHSGGSYVNRKLKGAFNVHYFAPQFTGNFGRQTSRFSFNWTFGIGMAYVEDKTRGNINGHNLNESHVEIVKGMNWGIGVQFAITRHVSAMFNLSVTDAFTKHNEFYEDYSGVARANYLLGVKYTF